MRRGMLNPPILHPPPNCDMKMSPGVTRHPGGRGWGGLNQPPLKTAGLHTVSSAPLSSCLPPAVSRSPLCLHQLARSLSGQPSFEGPWHWVLGRSPQRNPVPVEPRPSWSLCFCLRPFLWRGCASPAWSQPWKLYLFFLSRPRCDFCPRAFLELHPPLGFGPSWPLSTLDAVGVRVCGAGSPWQLRRG